MKKDYAPESNEESLSVSREAHNYYATHARRWRNRVGLSLLAVIFFFWGYTLFIAPFFSIHSVTVLGLNKIQPQEMQNRIAEFLDKKQLGIFTRGNIFLFSTNSIVEYFKNDARIAVIHAQKNYLGRSLIVTIEERVPIYILSFPDRAFAIDRGGIALIPLTVPVPQGTLPIVIDKRKRNAILGTRVIADMEIKLLNTINEELTHLAPFTNMMIGEPSEDAMTVRTEEGWGIYFDLSDTPKIQLERLRVLLSAKIKPEKRKKLQYIDLRFGEKVYYK